MAKSAAIFPEWTKTLGSMIDDYHEVQAVCDLCRWTKKLTRDDLAALADRVGRDYSLINRRCRCRIKTGCTGWNRFHYMGGVMRPLWTEKQALRWFLST